MIDAEYVDQKRAAEILMVDRSMVKRVAAAASVRIMQLPGMAKVRYNRADLEALAARSVSRLGQPASRELAASA